MQTAPGGDGCRGNRVPKRHLEILSCSTDRTEEKQTGFLLLRRPLRRSCLLTVCTVVIFVFLGFHVAFSKGQRSGLRTSPEEGGVSRAGTRCLCVGDTHRRASARSQNRVAKVPGTVGGQCLSHLILGHREAPTFGVPRATCRNDPVRVQPQGREPLGRLSSGKGAAVSVSVLDHVATVTGGESGRSKGPGRRREGQDTQGRCDTVNKATRELGRPAVCPTPQQGPLVPLWLPRTSR